MFKYVNKIVFVLIFSLAASCGPKQYTIDPEFKPYVSHFEQLSGKKVDFDMVFDDLPTDKVGVCYSWYSYRKIKVDRMAWEEFLDFQREELIFHELGHCVLDRKHKEDMVLSINGDRIEASIMNPYIFYDQWDYTYYHEYYMRELFDENYPFTK